MRDTEKINMEESLLLSSKSEEEKAKNIKYDRSITRDLLFAEVKSTAITISLAGVTGFSVLMGMASALETLCGQAYGAQQYTRIGTQTYTAIFSLFLFAIPSAVMICLEWWSFELLVLMSGLLPNPQLETSVLSVCLNTIATLYTLPFGLGAAVSTRVSNELGAGDPNMARVAVYVVMLLTVIEAIIVSSILFASRHVFGYMFSNEKEVVDYVTTMAPLVCFSVIMDSIQGVLSGVARGCGWQHIGAFVNLGAFYLCGIPLAASLGFWVKLRGMGLWIGVQAGAFTQTLMLSIITSCTDWEKQHVLADFDRGFSKNRVPMNFFSPDIWNSDYIEKAKALDKISHKEAIVPSKQNRVEHKYIPDPNTTPGLDVQPQVEEAIVPSRGPKKKSIKVTAGVVKADAGLFAFSEKVNIDDTNEKEDDDQGTVRDFISQKKRSQSRYDRPFAAHPSLSSDQAQVGDWTPRSTARVEAVDRIVFSDSDSDGELLDIEGVLDHSMGHSGKFPKDSIQSSGISLGVFPDVAHPSSLAGISQVANISQVVSSRVRVQMAESG
ncbi:hypothetical protein Q3G72_023883 [Acer saccharum]|nr:hypothetical protein Q3G72_023883 [Acer saccharum]